MLKTTPLVATVGLGLTIPLATTGDFLLGGTVRLMTLLGAFLVVGSFIVVGLEDSKNEDVLAATEGDWTGIQLSASSEMNNRPDVPTMPNDP